MKEQIKKKNTKSPKNIISPEARVLLTEYKDDMKQHVDTLAKALSKTLSEDFQRERKTLSEDVGRHMGALSEDFQGKVTAVAEQFSALSDKVDKVIHVQEAHTEMIGVIMEDVSEIKIELKNKADKTEVVRLERRVFALEQVAL